MGEIAVARNSGLLRTLLGSCLGVTLYDRRNRAGALAHIVLPQSLGRSEKPGKFADTAIPAMIELLSRLTEGATLKLQAKIAGGANMFVVADAGNTIGTQNVQAVERALGELRIPIVGRHCGGEQGRRMTLDTATGLVSIDIVGFETVSI